MSPSRISLCLFWAISVAVTVVIWVLVLDVHDTPQSPNVGSKPSTVKQLTSSLNKKRKLFHALAVIMFVPGMLYEPAFLQLAFSVALAAFIYLEYLRFFAVWPYGKNIHMFLTEFIDSRDLGPVILSHVYLLLGCAESVWLEG
jgi:dolichol kinase